MMKYAFLFLIPLFMACEEPLSLNEKQVDKISYSFHDSSVAPQYHRSYTIIVKPTKVFIKVDSYGDILADKEYDLKESDFSNLIQTINDSELSSLRIRSEGCDGGTSESLTISENNQNIYSADIDNCGGTLIPESAGDYKAVTKAICNLVPDLNTLLD